VPRRHNHRAMPDRGPLPRTSRIVVLGYHGISHRWPEAVSPASLKIQLRLLLARGYRPASFTQSVLNPPTGKTVVVTFDDGYRSVIEEAFPILASLGVPGTVFVPTDFVGAEVAAWPGTDHWIGSGYEQELTPMTWGDLGVLRDAGWEIGSHARTHPHLVRVDDDRLAEELVGSRSVVEHELGGRCLSLAYPYGEADARVASAARAAGYQAACTLTSAFESSSPLTWPRVGIYRHDGAIRFRAKVSPVVCQLRATRLWSLLRPDRVDDSSE
jgi:peptidoglycan/xylan/chitin deacetylase (PgdA/CDA1 family)